MNWIIFWYLLTGYLMAFNSCSRAERRGKPFGFFDTGFVILINTFFWLPFQVIATFFEASLIIISKIVDKKLKKS